MKEILVQYFFGDFRFRFSFFNVVKGVKVSRQVVKAAHDRAKKP